MAHQVDRERFLALLTDRFPDVAADIDDVSAGLLHLEIATVRRATQAAIDANDRNRIQALFRFIDEVFRDGTPEIRNAVAVSYLEDLRFEGRKAAPAMARELLTPRLRSELAALEAYLDRLFGKDSQK